jgi:nucleoside-diphosphate-sugar epimerase
MNTPGACWFGRRNPVVDPIYVTDVADCIILASAAADPGQVRVLLPMPQHLRGGFAIGIAGFA